MTYDEMTPEQQAKIDAEEAEREERKARRERRTERAQALEDTMARTPIYSAEWWRLSALYERALGLH